MSNLAYVQWRFAPLRAKSRGVGDGVLARLRVISIINDDASVRESTARLVRSLGYCAAVFSSAEEYLHSDRMRERRPAATGRSCRRSRAVRGEENPHRKSHAA